MLTPEARERMQRYLDDAIIGYRACGWPGCRKPKGHKGRCAPADAGILGTPGITAQAGKGGVFSEEDIRKAVKVIEAQTLDLPGGPAPRTVPRDPESVEEERRVREAFKNLTREQREFINKAVAERRELPGTPLPVEGLVTTGRELAAMSDERAAEFRRRMEAAKEMEESTRPD
jgi:hypothetical protein